VAVRPSSSAGPGVVARRAVPTLLVAIAVYYAVWGGEYSLFDLRTLSMRQQAAEVELAELRRQVDSLRLVEEALENDPETIEAVAREQFGMIRDGELLYRFVDMDSASAP